LREACHRRRALSPEAPSLRELLGRVEQMPLEIAAPVARAFTLFFLLINTAEQVHRVRRRQQYGRSHQNSSQPASIRWAFEQLKQMGMSSAEVREAVSKVRARPVLTAHPTEATRRTVLDIQARMADALVRHDDATDAEKARLEEQLE